MTPLVLRYLFHKQKSPFFSPFVLLWISKHFHRLLLLQ